MTDDDVEKIIKRNMNLQMNLAGIRADFEEAQQRTWVVLTDDEIDQGLCRTPYVMKSAEAWREGVRWAYHQLKEKNNA